MPLSGNERRLIGGGDGINSRASSAEAEKSSSLWTFGDFFERSVLCCADVFYMLRREKLQQYDGLCVPGLTS